MKAATIVDAVSSCHYLKDAATFQLQNNKLLGTTDSFSLISISYKHRQKLSFADYTQDYRTLSGVCNFRVKNWQPLSDDHFSMILLLVHQPEVSKITHSTLHFFLTIYIWEMLSNWVEKYRIESGAFFVKKTRVRQNFYPSKKWRVAVLNYN